MTAEADHCAATGVSIGTPAGEWRLTWEPTRATFAAAHRRRTDANRVGVARVDHQLGVAVGAYPSAGTLEEALGLSLSRHLRDALAGERDRFPALASPRGLAVPDMDRPRGADTYPTWESPVRVADGPEERYGLCVERERPVSAVDLGGGTRLEVLAGTDEPATASVRVAYRLSHEGRVIFTGDDVDAPAGTDLAADDAIRALLGVLVDPDATHRTRPLTRAQASFVAAHADGLLAAVDPPAHPFPTGTRVVAAGDGRHTGTVAHAIADRDGKILAYAWRPDAAALVGHPWRYQPDHCVISAPDRLSPTLAGPELGIPEAGVALAFGAVVAAADPTTGRRVEATVLRAFPTGDGFVYQVQPNTPEEVPAFTVDARNCAVVAGTWWPTARAVTSARKQAGIDIVAGEVIAGNANPAAVTVLGDGPVHPPALSPAQQAAALTVDVDEPAPSLIRVSTHGQLTRVGDPRHGWIIVETDRWLAAMCRPSDELRTTVIGHAPLGTLTGDEPRPTLAALAARHAPDTLGATPARLAQRFAPPAELTPAGAGL